MSARMVSIWIVGALCAAVCGFVAMDLASAAELPDGRVYEMVSPVEDYNGDVYQPQLHLSGQERGLTETYLPFQAAADGDGVVYVAAPTVGGNELSGNNGGNEYLARRAAGGGWTQSNISPVSAATSVYQAFSSDLSVGFVDSVEPLSSAAPGFGEVVPLYGSYDILYSTRMGSGEYEPLITATPPYRSKESFNTAGSVARVELSNITGGQVRGSRILAFAGASADASHALFLANDALTGASEGRPAAEGGAGSVFEKEDNLYEWVNGGLRLVNVLPDGTTHANATFGGGGPVGFSETKFERVISADGSRIFWTDLNTGHIYVRENGVRTVEVSSAGKYQTASSDGSVVFYANGDLYEYELEGARTTDLTPGVPVEKVVGSSEDGKYVYYVTTTHEFKLWHDGSTTTIAAVPVTRAEVTPDGHSVVFFSGSAGNINIPAPISVYDTDTGLVYCASCAGGATKGLLVKSNDSNVYRPRWISADGSRVFFDSFEAQVPQDTNGAWDVYEWERPGAGECHESEGCVYLLSGASSTQGSFFADAGENGDDVFIITRARLIGADENELFDLYDVRAHGAIPVAAPACTGTGCQGIPDAPPIFATPSSVTFEGVGNFAAPSPEGTPKSKPKKKLKHKVKKKPKHNSKKSKGKSARVDSARMRSGTKGGRS